MLGAAKLIALVATTNATEARRFYEGVLGLRLVEDSPFALVFDAAGTMLRVAKVPSLSPMPFTVLGWEVADIGEAVKGLIGAGVQFERFEGMAQDELGIWYAPDNAAVAWFKDPDGNLLSLTQFGVQESRNS